MINKAIVIMSVLITCNCVAQVHNAKIVYERKTNLYKIPSEDDRIKRWVKEEDKIKTEYFEMFITDTMSLFRPQESDIRENFQWLTTKNTVLQDFQRGTRFMIKPIWGEETHLTDSIVIRKWKITESTRKIAGYTCRKAMWRANDSTRIYAWFSYDLTPSTGPESFNGLPGTILGLATEDGGVVYFAKKVEVIRPDPREFVLKKKKKVFTMTELKAQLTKQYGHEKWFKREVANVFSFW
jgi:GLPGLI family protein